jgi:hypothetical protein
VATYRRHYAVTLADGETVECVQKGRSLQIACGDRVGIARMAGGGAIESVAPRTSLLYRSDAFREKLIAANVTQIVGVVAPGLGLDEELINRWMIAAESQGCRFVLAANKSDLPQYAELLQRLAPFAALGYAIVELSALSDAAPINTWLAGNHSVPRRPVGDGQVHDREFADSLRGNSGKRGVGGAGYRAPHDDRDDAIPAPCAGHGHLDRRFTRDEGVRARASRPRSNCGGLRRTASAAWALPLSRLPSRCRTRMRDPGGGL